MKSLLFVLAFVALSYASNVGVAHLKGTSLDSGIDGIVYFVQLNDTYVWVWAQVKGITQNADKEHGMHVHQFGDITDVSTGLLTGGHFVGRGSTSHSCFPNSTRHQGDMGNWQVTGGTFTLSKTLDLLTLTSDYSMIGKGVVLHNATDDCGASGLPTGNAGSRLATGVIGIANPAFYPAEVAAAVQANGETNAPNTVVSGDTTVTKAVAYLMPTAGDTTLTNVMGTFYFEQDITSNFITITGQISGLTAGNAYGVHIHTYADWYTGDSVNGTAAGGHYNSTPSTHAGPLNATRHSGDLGNICVFSNGVAYYSWVMKDAFFSLNKAANVVGRNVIIHSIYDAMNATAPLGNRVSQGVIGVLNATVLASNRITLPTATFDPTCAVIPPAPTNTPAPTNKPSSSSSGGQPVGTTSSASSSLFVSVFVVVCAAFVAFF